jgi:succinoglycan biosynthesis transport protein ExoP
LKDLTPLTGNQSQIASSSEAAVPVPSSGYRGAPIPTSRVQLEEEQGIDLRHIVGLVFRRRKILIVVFLTVVALGALQTSLQKRVYESSGTLLVNASAGRASSAASELPILGDLIGATQARTIETQIEILKSVPIRQGAMERLTASERRSLEAYADTRIAPVRDTDVVNVSVLSHSAQASASMVKAITQEYIEQSQERNRSQVQSATRYVSTQLNDVRDRLNKAQTALKRYKEGNNTFDLPAESQARITALSTMEAALREAQTERAANAAQAANLRGLVAKQAPNQVTQSTIARRPTALALQEQLTKLELERLATRQEYAPDSPEVRNVEDQIAVIRRRLVGEAQTEVASSQLSANPLRQTLTADLARAQSQIWALDARIRALQTGVQTARTQLTQLPEREYQLGKFTNDVASLQQIYQMLNEKYQTLRISEEANISNAVIVSPAQVPQSPVSPHKARNLLMSVVLGAMLAFAVAALVDRMDNRVHSEADAEMATGLPILAHVPFIKEVDKQTLVGNTDQPSMLLESYRMLRTNIEFASVDEPVRIVVVTSSLPNEGKSTTSIDLAVIMALDGKKVIIVDADLRRPSVHRALHLPNRVGFTSVVAGTSTLEDALQDTGTPNMRALTSGPVPPSPPELLNSQAGRKLLRQVAELADILIIDTPPALAMVDAQIVASVADASLLVVSFQEANKHEIARTAALMGQTGTRVLGLVLNKLTSEAGGYYGYYGYNYRYSSYLQLEDGEETAENGRKSFKNVQS